MSALESAPTTPGTASGAGNRGWFADGAALSAGATENDAGHAQRSILFLARGNFFSLLGRQDTERLLGSLYDFTRLQTLDDPAVLKRMILDGLKELEVMPAAYQGMRLDPSLLILVGCISVGASAIPRELEERTITFLFLRPIPKWTIFAGNYLATVVMLGLLTTVSFGAFVATCGLRGGSARDLGGTAALVTSWESRRQEFDQENQKLRREHQAVRREEREVEREVEEAGRRGDGAPVPDELRVRREELERRLRELERQQRERRFRGGEVGWLFDRWQASPDHIGHAPLGVGILWLGLAAYTALFFFLGAAVRHYFMAGIFYAVLYQLVVMPLFKNSRIKWTVLNYHVQTLLHNEVLAAPGPMVATYLGHSSADALLVLAGTTLFFIAAGGIVFSRREYVLKQ